MPPSDWLFTLLNGLEPATTRSTQHVLRVIRLRLERYQRERRRARGLRRTIHAGIGSPLISAMSPRTCR